MPYMIISGGEVRSATDIKKIFSVARLKKSCIIFFDEFDANDKKEKGEKKRAQKKDCLLSSLFKIIKMCPNNSGQ